MLITKYLFMIIINCSKPLIHTSCPGSLPAGVCFSLGDISLASERHEKSTALCSGQMWHSTLSIPAQPLEAGGKVKIHSGTGHLMAVATKGAVFLGQCRQVPGTRYQMCFPSVIENNPTQ